MAQQVENKKFIKGCLGNMVLETLFTLPLFMSFVAMGMLIIYLIFSKTWIYHHGYEGLICLAEGQSTSTCESQFTHKMKIALSFGEFSQIKFKSQNQGKKKYEVLIKWQLTYDLIKKLEVNINYHKKLHQKDLLKVTRRKKRGMFW